MGRNSFNSKQNFLTATSLRPSKSSRKLSLADQLIETRLQTEQAKLAMLQADLPDETPKYMRYEDMPPPSPEQEAEFDREFQGLLESLFDGPDEPMGPEEGQTVQDWLTELGASIPDLPDWQTPLYLKKWDRV